MIIVLYTLVLFGSTGIALWRGGPPERTTALFLMFASLATPFAPMGLFESVEVGFLLLDLAVLAFLATVALTSDRFWPLWACGFQLVSTAMHLARWADPGIWPPAYANAEAFWAYPIQLSLAVGTLMEVARRR